LSFSGVRQSSLAIAPAKSALLILIKIGRMGGYIPLGARQMKSYMRVVHHYAHFVGEKKMKTQILLIPILLQVTIGLAAGQAPPPPPPGPVEGAPAPSNYSPGPVEIIPPPTYVGSPQSPPPPGPEPLPLPTPEIWTRPNPAGPQGGWLNTEFIFWWIHSMPNPTPLATNGSLAPGNASPGAFGQPGTTAILLGGQNSSFSPSGGLRISGGDWFGYEQRFGLEGSFFYMAQQTVHQGLSSDDFGNPGIYRPVNDINQGESSLFVALPNMASGAMTVSSASELLGAEVNGLFRLVQATNWNLTVVGGFRFLNLDEHINIRTLTNDFSGVLTGPDNQLEVPGSTLAVFDGFHTSNQFYGGQLGFQTTAAFGSGWYITGRAILGLGDTVQNISISGTTTQLQPGVGEATAQGGGLNTAANIGHYSRNAFSVVPEAQLKIGYQLGRFTNLFIGYNFLYWSNVVRPGSTISRTVDFNGIPTSGLYNPAGPILAPAPPSFVNSAFWAQGINLGILFTF
jgi:hypothetical protein